MLGTRLANRYLLVEAKHETATADIYVALDSALGGQRVLAKIARATPERFDVARLRNERTALIRLRAHPWFPTLIDILQLDGGRECLVVDIIDGMTLKEAIDRARGPEPMTLARAVPIAIMTLQALRFAAREGVFHRNLTLDSVLVTREPIADQVRIVDFYWCGIHDTGGAASFPPLFDAHGITKPAFKAPEVIRDRSGQYDPFLADIYSVGCILYSLACGRAPFGPRRPDVKKLGEQTARPTILNPQVTQQLEDAILRAIDSDPARRFQTAEDFEHELADVHRDLLISTANARDSAAPFVTQEQLDEFVEWARTRAVAQTLVHERVSAQVLKPLVEALDSVHASVRAQHSALAEAIEAVLAADESEKAIRAYRQHRDEQHRK